MSQGWLSGVTTPAMDAETIQAKGSLILAIIRNSNVERLSGPPSFCIISTTVRDANNRLASGHACEGMWYPRLAWER